MYNDITRVLSSVYQVEETRQTSLTTVA